MDSSLAWDTWPVKIGVLGMLLLARYALHRQSRRSKSELWKAARENLDSMTLALSVLFLVLQPFVAEAYLVPSGSMEGTLQTGDKILTSKIVYHLRAPQAGDVVVFEAPPAALVGTNNPPGTLYVKRCIGAPGDVVEIRNRALWRNGRRVAEPYTRWADPGQTALGHFSYDMKIVGNAVYHRDYDPFTGTIGLWEQGEDEVALNQAAISAAPADPVPRDSFLMLGDHRNASLDGHLWGFVPRKNIIGKAFAVFWPPRDLGTLDRKSGF